MSKEQDHYETLGVPRDESSDGIRRAFRQRARDCHPDCAGPDCEERFKELNHAHEVLSDPESRRDYDRELDRQAMSCTEETVIPSARRRRQRDRFVPVEPMRAQHQSPSGGWAEPLRPEPIWAQPPRPEPMRVEPMSAPRRQPPTQLQLQLSLSPDEAWAGAAVPLRLHIEHSCPVCGGSGRFDLFPCLECRGRGVLPLTRSFWLELPPGLRGGELLEHRVDFHPDAPPIEIQVEIHTS